MTLLSSASDALAARFNWSNPVCVVDPNSDGCYSVGSKVRFNGALTGANARDILVTIVARYGDETITTWWAGGGGGDYGLVFTNGTTLPGRPNPGLRYRFEFVNPGTTTVNPLAGPVYFNVFDTDGDGYPSAGFREVVNFITPPAGIVSGTWQIPVTPFVAGTPAYGPQACQNTTVWPCDLYGPTGWPRTIGVTYTGAGTDLISNYAVYTGTVSGVDIAYGKEVGAAPPATGSWAWSGAAFSGGIPDADLRSTVSCAPSAGVTTATSVTCTVTCQNYGPELAVSPVCSFTGGIPAGATLSSTCTSPPTSIAYNGSLTCTATFTPPAAGVLSITAGAGAYNDTNGAAVQTAGNNPSSTSLTVTSASADMSAAFSGLPTVVRPGQVSTGLTLTCTNVSANAATAATCVPTVSAGTISAVSCAPATPAAVAASGTIVCSFTHTAPGAQGGADEATTSLTFTGTTGATNDTVPGNNVVTANATVIDAVNDTDSKPGGATGQTTSLVPNDQYPISSVFSPVAGGTCANASVSGAGVATYDVPLSGSCTVNYQVCAPAPNTTSCDTATLTVTGTAADMSAAFSGLPTVVSPGQAFTGLTLTCTNVSPDAAVGATCVPTASVGTVSAVSCSPATPATVAAAGTVVCTFSYTAPGTQGGADEPTTSVTFTGTTGAANDTVPGNNVVTADAAVIDAVNDTDSKTAGTTGQTTSLVPNDQYPLSSVFSPVAGGTCANASVSGAGVATYDVPLSGTCTVNYQVCAPAPNTTSCDTATLTVTAVGADMSAAFSGLPTVVSPGQAFTGLNLTCSNVSANTAMAATCVPTASVGTVSAVSCSPATPVSVAAAGTVVCTFSYTAPGTQGGADEPTTSVTFTGTTGAANDSFAGNNVVTATATVIDAVNDTASVPGGTTGQTTSLVPNDQYPFASTFSPVAGGTCANASVSGAGVATYDVPASGSCTVNYQVCAPSPNATTCDTATLTVTAISADMSAAFTGLPTVVRPGQAFSGLTLTCTNVSANAATAATCVPTASAGSISGVICSPSTPALVAAGNAITCVFSYAAPGTQGGADEPTTSVTFTGTTGAANDSVAANNVVTATASVIDAVNDTDSKTGGAAGQTTSLVPNDQYPPSSVFSPVAGGTCANASVSGAGVATYDVPATGTCTVNYQVCAPAPDTATCDTATLTVTATAADMSAAFSGLPTVVRPGQVSTGLALTCTNVSANAAVGATCVPTASVGAVSAVSCSPATPVSVAAAGTVVCTFSYTAPGTQGGADEPTTSVTFTGTTGAANDSVAANNVVTASATVIDAVNDTDSKPGGATGQTTSLVPNDQYPLSSVFSPVAGGTCANASVSGAGVATYDVPMSGTCTVNYQVCAPAPNTTACDTATLTVTATAADMSAAFSGLPTVVRPGQVSTGLALTCTNVSANTATAATCVPTASVGIVSAVSCSPATPVSVAAAGTVVCTFSYTAPGTQGGADEPTTSVTFTGTTGAANDSVAANNVVTASATVIDAVNDTASLPGGTVGQTTNLSLNDQYPIGATFSVQPGSTCLNASVSGAGMATYDVSATGTCVVNYQVCAPAPDTATCDTATLTVTALPSDMSAAFTDIPSVVRPGQVLTGLTLTCANAATMDAATAATCVPTVNVGTISGVICSPSTPTTVGTGGAIVCVFTYSAPGIQGGADEPTTSVTFTGTTGATNDSVPANNVARTTLTVVDAVDDTANLAGGLTGQTTNLATNDQYPVNSTFSMLPGTTCAASSVSTTGTATYNVPGTGSCVVAYRVCAPAPNITTCDTAVLTVTAAISDMAAAFTGVPTVVRPGQSFTGLTLTCTNGTGTLATSATCAPTVNTGTISNTICTPVSGTNVVAGGTIVCTFDYVAPGVQGGTDEPTSSVTFTGTTGAANDSNPANNVALTTAIYLDAIDDGTVAAGGLTAQTFNVATNDEFPAGSTFAPRAGSTCANVSVSASGVATFDVPGTGACVVNYEVCAPVPNATTCDTAKLTVTSQPADMAAAFSGLPSVVRPSQTFVGLSLTCTNSLSGVSATAAGCAPTVSAGTITGLSCTPAVGGNVIPGSAIVCTFGYTAPGTQGGADEPVNVVTFTGTTGALNDTVAANNVVNAPAQMVDAVDDAVTVPGGRTAQTADVSGNDQYPAGSSFTLIPGSTCVGTSMASGGVATFDVPATGTCVVNYQVCAPVAGLVTCDTATLTVTAGPADMAATFSNLPTVLRPGLVSTGLTLTCTNVSATGSATSAGCVPTASVGVVTNVSCVPTTGTNVAAGSAIVCTFDYQAPGVMGGADEPTTSVTFTGTTGALNDTNAANNVVTATAPMVDAVNDTASAPGGLTGQTTNLATNDQYPVSSTFTVQPGSTCANTSVSGAGVATYDVPVTGTCVVNYQVCAAAPNATVCDNATLTVTASNSDMSAAFSGLPTVVRPGLVSSGLTLTCANVSANAAVGATCVPTVNAGTISAVSCTPATPTTVAAAGTIVCTFTYTAPGVMGGADEPTLSVTFTGTTGATNDTVLANNVVTATAPMVDAVNDAVAVAGGLTGQTTNLAANDQYPVDSTFVIQPGSTCAAASVSATGTATFNVPNSGSCTVNYQVCAPSPNATVCDNATLTVTAGAADMSSAFTNMPSVLRPGQPLTGLVLTCTNAAGGSAATAASCVPTVSAGNVANVVCSPATGSNVAAGAAISCTFDYTAPGVLGGADEPTTNVTFTGTTGALNDTVAANNVVTTVAPMVDAVNDTAGAPGGSTGQTTNLATNDQFPAGSTFTVQPGSTCANASVSGAGVATYDVPASGTCVVNYQLCAPAPNAATCDTATLTVTAGAADMAAAFSNMPSALRPGQVLSGLTLTCTNVTAGVSATSASCAPTVSAGTISAVSCSPAVGGNVAGGAAIVCTFSYTAPGVMGGADEPTLSVTFTGTTGAVNDSVSTNNVVTAVAPMVDAVNDVVGLPGGLTAQSTNLAANDQYPVGSTFVIQPGSTCAAASVSATGTAMFNVPNSGTCTINYQVCAPSPSATTCDNATLTVTAGAADMSAAFSNMPSVLRPGQPLTGLVLTCTNAAGGSAATATSCVPTVSAGSVANVVCNQPTGSNVAAGAAITCTFDYTAPGVLGGADEPTTNVTFTGTTGALNDGRADNNVTTAVAPMVDAVNDTTGAPGGLPGQTADLAGNDQYPVGSTFVIQPGSTCAAASVSATGTATFNVPNSGTCTVNYQVCAPSPNATVCDNATLTVMAVSADMSAAFVGLPTVVNPGQTIAGLGLVCTNATTGGAATAATCVPTVSVGTISNVVCTPTSGANVAVGAAISCTFDYQAPGTQGGLNEPVTSVVFTGTTGALNDSRASNNVVETPATVIDALNDEVTLAGGLLAQKYNVAANDEYPAGAVFKSLGGTCANGSMTTAGVATFDVAASGSCTVDYEVCTADGRACDRATLTVRSGAADIQAAITDVPATIRAGTTYEGLKAVCSVAADGYAATGATCVPTVSVGTISNVVCTPASGSVVEAGKSMTCTFTYAAPASSVASVDFVVTAGALNDSNPANNRAEKKVALGYVNLAVSKTHAGEVREGGSVVYTLAVSNIGTAPTIGVVRVVDTLPAGLSVVSANGASWACGIVDQTVTCDSTDVIGAGMNAAPIVLTARVSTSACDGKAVNGSCKITNTATVSGGDERELSDLPTIRDNNASSDEAIVIEDEQPKLLIIKSGDRSTAEIGDSVRYTLVVRRQDKSTSAFAIDVIDRLPAGFRFIAGTAMIDGKPTADPQGGAGPLLRFKVSSLAANGSVTLTYRVRIGVGADEGTGVNTARATWIPGAMCAGDSPECSNEGRFAVRVEGGVFGANACVTGKIFVDCNNNHVQDAEELGIPGVRLVTSMGATIITDVEGKYSMCGLAPRGQSMTVDQTTLPRGSRLTTSSSRNAGDAGSLFIDVQKGELHRADFVEGSCSGAVIEQVKARRAVGETGTPATEKRNGQVLRFNSKPLSAPTQATDSADQRGGIVKERAVGPNDRNPAAVTDTVETINTPVSQQPGLSGTKPANAAGAK